jgi:hypothetical protein
MALSATTGGLTIAAGLLALLILPKAAACSTSGAGQRPVSPDT